MKIKTGRKAAIEVIDDYVEGVGIRNASLDERTPSSTQLYEVMDIRGTDDLILQFSLPEIKAVRKDLRKVVELIARRAFARGYEDGKLDGADAAKAPLRKVLKDLLG